MLPVYAGLLETMLGMSGMKEPLGVASHEDDSEHAATVVWQKISLSGWRARSTMIAIVGLSGWLALGENGDDEGCRQWGR